MRPQLVRLVIYLLVMIRLTLTIAWFTWQNVTFVLHTRSCQRQGQC
jgi:hypothetical protein